MGMNAALVAGVLAVALIAPQPLPARGLRRRRSPGTAGTRGPTATMAYTASSFAQILVGLYGWLLRPRSRGRRPAAELFPPARSFHTSVPEQVMEGVLAPLWAGFRRALGRCARSSRAASSST